MTLAEELFAEYERVRAGKLVRPREYHDIPQHEREAWEHTAAYVTFVIDKHIEAERSYGNDRTDL